MDFTSEIKLQTTRSGGKGGQNVNKVETAVIASLHIDSSQLLSPEQKALVQQKLSNRINTEGNMVVKAQTHRTQLENKQEAIKKINDLITEALKKKKIRLATKPSRASKVQRVESKKRKAEIKAGRQKFRPGNF